MSSLYIIGNGFDIAHGIPTDYWNFRIYLEEKHPEFLQAFERLYNIEPLDDTEPWYTPKDQEKWNKNVKRELWSIFEKKIGFPDTTGMECMSSSVLDNMYLDGGNIGIRDTMDDYWRQEYGFINQLHEYIKEWVSLINLHGVTPKKAELVENDKDYFFSFNYTDTLEKVYQIDHALHIHGSIGETADIDPIIGHCNKAEINRRWRLSQEADEKFDEGEASIQEAIAEYLSNTFKDTTSIIAQHRYFFDHLNTVDHVIIVGWSAGDVDIPYLKEIRNGVPKNVKWTIYYFDEDAYRGLYRAFDEVGILGHYETEFLPTKMFWDC